MTLDDTIRDLRAARENLPLDEKYRPADWPELVGQDKAVAEIKGWLADPGRKHALWLTGDTGTGKTTAARIIAAQFAEPIYVDEFDSADDMNAAAVDRFRDTMQFTALGKGGRVLIVNEAHGLRREIIRRLLGVLERLPRHVYVIFTTTRDGAGKLFEDYDDASPLLDRCEEIAFTTQGFMRPAAGRLRWIAQQEHADGEPESYYVGILKENGNSLRRAIGVLAKRLRAKKAGAL